MESQVLHREQFQHLFSTIRMERSLFQILVIEANNDARALSLLDRLDHKSGPRYLIECLPYFTVLKLGIKKSEFRGLLLDNDMLKRSIIFAAINLNFTLYMRIAISCRHLL